MKAYSNEKPRVLEPVGNGNYLYNYDIAEETREDERGEQRQWAYQSVTVCPPLTPNAITEAVITSVFPLHYELKVINDFNAASLNLCTDEAEATARAERYGAYLTERARLKAIIDADCERLGIHEV